MFPFSDSDVQHRSFPVVTLLLIAVNVLVFLYELQLGGLGVLGGGGDLDIVAFFAKWGFIPNELTQGVACTHQLLNLERCPQLPAEFLASPQAALPAVDLGRGVILLNVDTPLPTWTTLFSSMFIHGGFFHLAGNMMFLWVFGDNMEDWLGHLKFLAFYLLAGIAGTLSHLAIDPTSLTPLVGASGAISGVMGAYMLLYPFNRINTLIIFFIITVIRLPAAALLGLWFVWQLVQGLESLAISSEVSIAFFAHVGGFVTGAILAVVFALATRRPLWQSRRRAQPWDYWHQTGRGPE